MSLYLTLAEILKPSLPFLQTAAASYEEKHLRPSYRILRTKETKETKETTASQPGELYIDNKEKQSDMVSSRLSARSLFQKGCKMALSIEPQNTKLLIYCVPRQ